MTTPRITVCIATTFAAALIAAAARVPTKADAHLTETDSSTGHSAFLSPHIHPIETTSTLVYVANTPAGTIDVIDQKTQAITTRIPV
jgi:YVTN family beta-propeller protein